MKSTVQPSFVMSLLTLVLMVLPTTCFASSKAYVPTYDTGTVKVVDTSSNTVLTSISVGTTSPIGVAISSDGQRVYVAKQASGQISVIDTLIDKVVATFTVSGAVNGLALNPIGTRLYVTEKDGGTLRILDTASGTTLTTVGGMSNPVSVAVSPDGSKVFISNKGNGTVTILSTADNSTQTIALGGTLGGLALNPNGSRLYVAKSSSNSIIVINTATSGVIATVAVGTAPQHVIVSPDGNFVYATNTGSTTVSVIAAASNLVTDTITVGGYPDGLALTPAGDRLYVLNSAGSDISVMDTATKAVSTTILVGTRPRAYGPFIAASPSRLYVSNTDLNSIVAHDLAETGNASSQQIIAGPPTNLAGPTGLALFGNEIVAANSSSNSIGIFRKQDNGSVAPVRTIAGALTNLGNPGQLVVAGHEIYVANRAGGGHLAVFNLSENGNAPPKRELTTLDQLEAVALYGDELYLARTAASGDANTLYVFDRTASGAAVPMRTLSGASTGLATIAGIAVYKNEIFVANASGNSITVYDRTASGNTAPLRSIAGSSSSLNDPHGILVFGNDLYIADRGSNSILVFNRSDSGNVAPKRIIQGSRSGLGSPLALAAESYWEPMIQQGPALYGSSFAYDETNSTAVVYGGSDIIPSDLTWLWNGTSWSSKNSGNPSARLNGGMAYLAGLGSTILFGGWRSNDDSYLNETWNFNGTNWTIGSYSTPPSARANSAVAYDSFRSQFVLFGGAGPALLGDTWVIGYINPVGYVWQNRGVSGPGARHFSRMAFDADRRVTVLFGGQDGFPGNFLQDTWEWDGSNWSRKSNIGPDPRAAQAMAYDPVRKRVVMYGGGGYSASAFQDDAWEWTGSQWLRIDAGKPGTSDFGGLFYDKALKRMILLQRDGFMWGSARMLDTRPPEITQKVPAAGTDDVPRSATISISFNKEMDPSTFTGSTFYLDNGATGSITYDPGSKTVTFTPSAPLSASTTYTVTLTQGVKDASGTALASIATFSFTTITEIGGTISVDTTWRASKSPYVVSGNVTINSGVTLTIEPGTVVKFMQNVYVNVLGTLNSVGAPESKVYFTDYRDDSVGGDTNTDGTSTAPAAGWWWGIRALDGSAINLAHTEIRYAAQGWFAHWLYEYTAPVYKTGTGTLTLSNSVISGSSGYSLWINESTVTATISSNTIQNSSSYGIVLNNAGSGITISNNTISGIAGNDGIHSDNSSPVITGNNVTGSGRFGLYIRGSALPSTVSGNTFTANAAGNVGVETDSSGVVIDDSNSFSGPIYIVQGGSGTITRGTAWVNNRVYYVTYPFTVNAGITLTIPASRVVKFAQYVFINVAGTLSAVGSSGAQIYFTDFRDDIGGDSNGTADPPAAGWWWGLRVVNGGSADLRYTVIRYAAQGFEAHWLYDNTAPVYKIGSGTLNFANSVISGSSGCSLWINESTASATISNSTIQNSSSYGIILNNAGSGIAIHNNTISGIAAGDGIHSDNSSPVITGNNVTGSGRFGLYVRGATLPSTVSGNTFTANAAGNVGVETDSSGVVIDDSNIFSGPIYIVQGGSGTITRDTAWVNNRVYYVTYPFTINAGKTLSISTGGVVKFAQYVFINVAGTLSAIGTAGSQIYFTDFRDDIGGDSNGTADPPAAGWWWGLRLVNGGSADLRYAAIRYAAQGYLGYWLYDNTAPLYKTGSGALNLANSTISDASGHSILLQDTTATATINHNTIQNGNNYGIVLNNAGSGVTLDHNTISGIASNNGIHSDNSSPVITNNSVSGSGGYGLYVRGSALPSTVSGNTFAANAAGNVGVEADSSGVVIDNNNIFSGPIYVVAGGTLTRDTDWLNNWVYYVTTPFTVNAGRTLTISSGRIIKFAQDVYINVAGTLSAIGSSGSQIYFTDYRDDIGGDSNGTTDPPAAGWWYGLRLVNGGSADLQYTVIRYAAQGYFGHWLYDNTAPIYKIGTGTLNLANSTISYTSGHSILLQDTTATATINSNTIQNGSNYGIVLNNAGSGITIHNNTISGIVSNDGIHSDNSSPVITGNNVSGSGRYGLYVRGSALPTAISGNTFTTNSAGNVGVESDSSGVVVDDNNTFSGPIHIVAGGNVTRNTAWVNNWIYYVTTPFTVSSSKTLTIPAGRIVKFAQDVFINVAGTLSAVGSSGSHIYFTDYRDDIGGDSNGTTDPPAAGWWYGLRLVNGGSADLQYTVIRYAAQGYFGHWLYDNSAPIYKSGTGKLNLANSTITKNSGSAIQLSDTAEAHTISGNQITDNTGSGLAITNAGTAAKVLNNTIAGNGDNGISISGSSPLIQGNTIRKNTNNGIYVTGSTSAPSIFRNMILTNKVGVYSSGTANPLIGGSPENGNNIFDNTNYGVQNASADIEIDASFNWWGDASGPYHPISNILGKGNAVSDYVYFEGWLTSPAIPIAIENITPTSKAFGRVATGIASTAEVFTVSNQGNQSLTFNSILLSGVNPTEFQITQNSCNGQSLVNGASCTVSVAYAPTVVGPAQALLLIESNDIYFPLYSIPLTGAGSVALPFRDDFTGGGRAAAWSILNEDQPMYSLTEKADWLSLHTTATDLAGSTNNIKNMFFVPLPGNATRFAATARMIFPTRPNQNYQQGGVVLLADKNGAPDVDNYLRAGYVGSPSGRRFETASDIGGTHTGFQGVLNPFTFSTATPLWLRIVRQETSFRSEYSLDGTTYTLIQNLTGPWDIAYVGVYALNGNGSAAASIPVQFDYFEAYELPAVLVTPASADLGAVLAGLTSSTTSFSISNAGPGPLKVNSITLTGSNPTEFQLIAGTCGAPPVNVAAGNSCTFSARFAPLSEGSKSATVAINTNDVSTPVSNVTLNGTALPSFTLKISFLGTGGGSISSDANFGCSSPGPCSKFFAAGEVINLSFTRNALSLFTSGWSNACSGTGACQVTMTSNREVTATFTKQKPFKANGNYHDTLQAAYEAAPDLSEIRVLADTVTGSAGALTAGIAKQVTITGGYDADYANSVGVSVVEQPLWIRAGKLIIQNIHVRYQTPIP